MMMSVQSQVFSQCQSNALNSITATQEDQDGCLWSFDYTLNSGYTATSFRWEFDDGSISFLSNPSYRYSEGIQYTVCLTITDQVGCISQACTTIYPGDCPGGFCNYVEGDNDCCVDICIDEVEGWTWQLFFPTEQDEIPYLEGEDVLVNYCFEEDGIYPIILKYYDSNNDVVSEYRTIVEVLNCDGDDDPRECDYWLCYVDYFDRNCCWESITYSYNNVDFTYIFNTPWGGNSAGSSLSINEMSTFASILGIQYSNSQDAIEDCLKGAGESFGHFFLNSPYKIKSLNALSNCYCFGYQNQHADQKKVNFKDNCD